MSEVSAPVSTTVIAFDVAGAGAAQTGVSTGVDRIVAVARSLGFVTHDAAQSTLTLTLAPDSEIDPAMCEIAAAVAEFDQAASPAQMRVMIHHGVVFRAESAGQTTYVGSAIRSTQSALRRAPADGRFMATQEFSGYAAKLNGLSFRLEAMTGAAVGDRTSEVVFANGAVKEIAPRQSGPGPVAIDHAFVEFAKRRLAEDVGPFAGALVERAVKSSTAFEQLLPALSREVSGAVARARFEKDMLHFVESRSGN